MLREMNVALWVHYWRCSRIGRMTLLMGACIYRSRGLGGEMALALRNG